MNPYELADDVIDMLESWSKAYPISMFPDPTQEDIDYINAENKNLSARFFSHVGRHFIDKGFTPAINMLRQLAKEKAELEKQIESIVDKNKPEIDKCNAYIKQQDDKIAELEKALQDGIKTFGELQEQQLKDKFEKQSEPVAWMWSEDGCHLGVCLEQDKKLGKKEFAEFDIPLYTTPQTKPLSDEEINYLVPWQVWRELPIEIKRGLVRVIEYKVRGEK